MKYTRYDLKRRKSDNRVFAVVLIAILLLAFLIGTILSNFIMKNKAADNILPNPSNDAQPVNSKGNINSKFIVVQGGKFAKHENLEQAKKNLLSYGNPFLIQEQDGTRILLGIYNEEDSIKVINTLKEKNIDNSKITFNLQTQNNLCNEEIAAIINAELEVINKLSDKSIKSIQTDELKTWCTQLETVDSKSSNISVLNDIKAHVSALPKDLTMDKVMDIEVYIYNFLKNATNK